MFGVLGAVGGRRGGTPTVVPVPVNTATGTVSGALTLGSTLSVSGETWTNSPTSFAWQWQRAGVDIAGDTAATHVIVALDAGLAIRRRVVAINAGGSSAPAYSNAVTADAGVGPVLIQPYNRHTIAIGDSRTASGSGVSGVYGTSIGISGVVTVSGVDAFLGPLLDNRIRPGSYSNLGIGGQTLEQITAVPRSVPSQGLDVLAANEAAIAILYMGTNNSLSPTTIQDGGTARVRYDQVIKALTDPAYVYPPSGAVLPLSGGLAKTVIIFNETRRGISTAGTVNQTTGSSSNATTFHDFAVWLKKYDFASGDPLANPHVIVVDTFDDPLLADLTDTTNYYPLPGLFADGLHLSPTATWAMGKVAAARLASLIPADTNFAQIPTTATVASFTNPNPLFTGTGGSSSLSGAALVGAIPASTRVIVSNGTGVTITLSVNALGGNLGNELVVQVTGTATAGNCTVTIDQLSTSGAKALLNVATDVLRMSVRTKLLVTSGSVYQLQPILTYQNGSIANQFLANAAGLSSALPYQNVSPFFMFWKNAFQDLSRASYLTQITPNADMTAVATGVPTSIVSAVTLSFVANVATDVTLTLSQLGTIKVTD